MKTFLLFLPFWILFFIYLFQGLFGDRHTWFFGRYSGGASISVGGGSANIKWERSLVTALMDKPIYEKQKSLETPVARFFNKAAIFPYYSPPPGPRSLRLPLWIPLLLVFLLLSFIRMRKRKLVAGTVQAALEE